jgi:hypothetical protein
MLQHNQYITTSTSTILFQNSKLNMSINCLCLIHPTHNPSWITVTRLRKQQDNKNMPRYDEVQVYLPAINGITKVAFSDSLNKQETQNLDKKNGKFAHIQYSGMEEEHQFAESRAVVIKNSWTVWNESLKTFSKNVNIGIGNYYIINFPLSYWEGLN